MKATLGRQAVVQAVVGLLIGYLLLHPVSMLIFQWLDPRLAMSEHSLNAKAPASPLVHSFTLEMVPMGLVFAFIGAVVAALDGYRRGIISRQRDDLKRQNQQLIQLELTNRRTAQFMAHDFKTHLGCISEFTNHLIETKAAVMDAESTEILKRIRRQSHLMFDAVMDFLAFGRLQDGGEIRKREVCIGAILQNALQDLSLPDHEDRLAIGEKHRHCPLVFADPRLLNRILVNLVSNALKHNPKETLVFLDAEVVDREILVSCSDTGRGIPPDLADSLFKAQAKNFNTHYEHSTGLGLAFCRAAVEAHGGRIWCEASPPWSTRVCFTLPI